MKKPKVAHLTVIRVWDGKIRPTRIEYTVFSLNDDVIQRSPKAKIKEWTMHGLPIEKVLKGFDDDHPWLIV